MSLGMTMTFLDTKLKVWSIKEIIDKPDFIKIKKLLPPGKQCQENERTSHTALGT